MAENKKSFILYADLLHVVKKLVLQDRANKTNHAGELFLHILEYVNDNNPVPIDFIVDMAFEPIKQQLKRDLLVWDVERKSRSEAGKKGMENRWKGTKPITDDNTVIPVITNITDNVTVTVNDSVNVTDIVIKEKQPPANADFDAFLFSFNSITGKKFKESDSRKKSLRARMKQGNTLADIARAVLNCFNSEHHQKNPHYLTPDFILKQDKLEMYLNYSKNNSNGTHQRNLRPTGTASSAIIEEGRPFGKL